MIYLDNAATTQIDPEVLATMMPWLTSKYGNAGTLYRFGAESRDAIQKAREQVATFIGADDPGQIIFTSGGTEANNLVFYSQMHNASSGILTSLTEHDSILRSAKRVEENGCVVQYLTPDDTGCIRPENVETALRSDGRIGLVSVMYMNNETGAENDIREISNICKKHGVLFHTDCVQAAGCCDINVNDIGCEFLSISSHKIHGPKGMGALYVRSQSLVSPLILGGSAQEFGLRGGTENIAGIVGFGKACEIMTAKRHDIDVHCSTLKQLFYLCLNEELRLKGLGDIVHINGPSVIKHGKTINVRFDGVDGETMLLMLDHNGVCVSAGSACTSHESTPSHVLTAMGITPNDARHSIRISFSKYNTREEVAEAARLMAECAATILSWAPQSPVLSLGSGFTKTAEET